MILTVFKAGNLKYRITVLRNWLFDIHNSLICLNIAEYFPILGDGQVRI